MIHHYTVVRYVLVALVVVVVTVPECHQSPIQNISNFIKQEPDMDEPNPRNFKCFYTILDSKPIPNPGDESNSLNSTLLRNIENKLVHPRKTALIDNTNCTLLPEIQTIAKDKQNDSSIEETQNSTQINMEDLELGAAAPNDDDYADENGEDGIKNLKLGQKSPNSESDEIESTPIMESQPPPTEPPTLPPTISSTIQSTTPPRAPPTTITSTTTTTPAPTTPAPTKPHTNPPTNPPTKPPTNPPKTLPPIPDVSDITIPSDYIPIQTNPTTKPNTGDNTTPNSGKSGNEINQSTTDVNVDIHDRSKNGEETIINKDQKPKKSIFQRIKGAFHSAFHYITNIFHK